MGRGSKPAGWAETGLLISGRLEGEGECAEPRNTNSTQTATQSSRSAGQRDQREELLREGRGLRGWAVTALPYRL